MIRLSTNPVEHAVLVGWAHLAFHVSGDPSEHHVDGVVCKFCAQLRGERLHSRHGIASDVNGKVRAAA